MGLRYGLAAAALAVLLPLHAWAGAHRLTMRDVGLGFLDHQHGPALLLKPLQGVERLSKARPSVSRLRGDLSSFFTEYDVLASSPLEYQQVGEADFDRFFFSSAKTSGTVKASRRLVDKVASNLVGLAKDTAVAGELGQAEAMLKDDPDAAAQQALAVLRQQRDQLGESQRDSLVKMVVALSGTGMALKEATETAPQLLKDGEQLTRLANPGALQRRFGLNFGQLAKIPAIVTGTGKSVGALTQVTQDAPALAKNVAVLTAGLVSLLE